jgi:hypothetical protein
LRDIHGSQNTATISRVYVGFGHLVVGSAGFVATKRRVVRSRDGGCDFFCLTKDA